MKRYSFSAFEMEEGNRQAYEICRAVADLQPVAPQPVILLGDEGAGKTHLLYAIVNRVRAASATTGLAYVTAHDFPEQVCALISDQAPLKRAESAILLVDQLEQFSERVEELEAIVRIFLDHHHSVVFASSVHPGRLTNVSQGLREIIGNGQVIDVQPRKAPAAHSGDVGHDKLVEQQREEIQALRTQLASGGAKQPGADATALEALRADLERERGAAEGTRAEFQELQDRTQALAEEAEKYREHLEAAVEEKRVMEGELARLQSEFEKLEAGVKEREVPAQELAALREEKDARERELAELREQVASMRDQWKTEQEKTAASQEGLEEEREASRANAVALDAALAERDALERELGELRRQVDVIGTEWETAQEKAADLDVALSEKARAGKELEAVSRELEAAQREGVLARQEANRLVERAEALLREVESNRGAFAETEDMHAEQLRTLEDRLERQGVAKDEALDAARVEAEAARVQVGELRQAFSQTRESLDAELETARKEAVAAGEARDVVAARLDEVTAALDEGTSFRANLELEMGRLREALEAQEAEAARTRNGTAAVPVDIEERLSRVYAAFDLTRQTGHVVGVGLSSVREQLAETVEALAKLAGRLAEATNVTLDEGEPAGPAAAPKPYAPEAPPSGLLDLPDTSVKFPKPEV